MGLFRAGQVYDRCNYYWWWSCGSRNCKYGSTKGLTVKLFEPKQVIDKACGEGLMPAAVQS